MFAGQCLKHRWSRDRDTELHVCRSDFVIGHHRHYFNQQQPVAVAYSSIAYAMACAAGVKVKCVRQQRLAAVEVITSLTHCSLWRITVDGFTVD